jgi:hypothetical protein
VRFLTVLARAALVGALLGSAAGCTSDPPGTPPPNGLFTLPAAPCGGVDFAPFVEIFGEPAIDPVAKTEPRTAQCAQLFSGVLTEEGERKPGGSVQIFLHRFETPSDARAAYQRLAPSPTPTPEPDPSEEADPSATPTTPETFPAPVEGIELIRYDWSYGNVGIELVTGNVLVTVTAASLSQTAPPPPPEGESAPPDPMLTLPQRAHDLTVQVLANLSG